MLLCDSCYKIYDEHKCALKESYIVCIECYKYYDIRLIPIIYDIYDNMIPIIYDKHDNMIPLYHINKDPNFIEHAELLIHFSKKIIK